MITNTKRSHEAEQDVASSWCGRCAFAVTHANCSIPHGDVVELSSPLHPFRLLCVDTGRIDQ